MFVQSGGYINNTRNYTSLPTPLSMINEPFICNSFRGLSSKNIPFPSSDAFRKTSDNPLILKQSVLYLPLVILLKALLQGKYVPL